MLSEFLSPRPRDALRGAQNQARAPQPPRALQLGLSLEGSDKGRRDPLREPRLQLLGGAGLGRPLGSRAALGTGRAPLSLRLLCPRPQRGGSLASDQNLMHQQTVFSETPAEALGSSPLWTSASGPRG